MTSNKNLNHLLNFKFNLQNFENIDFGRLEGERDPKLESSFFPTKSIVKYLNSPYNYVLSPKGAGKSALFRVLSEKYERINYIFDFNQYSIISINEAFGFTDDDYLNTNKFKLGGRQNLTVSWALYLLSNLINDIQKNHSDKYGYDELITYISKFAELKDRFNLYNLGDFLSRIKACISFTANGQEFEVSPSLKVGDNKNNKIILNKIFHEINLFYKKNNLKALILIDRIDNFVQREEYNLQRKYIQGLIDCIEEISLFSNIIPTLFLRTDLFLSYDSDIEYDKIKDRTIELKWDEGETLNFILYRLDANTYFFKNFRPILDHFIEQANQGKHRKYTKIRIPFWKRIINSISFKDIFKENVLDTKIAFNYAVSEQYLHTFFPEQITINNITIDFTKFISEYLRDANGFVNPRLLIYFYNKLFEKELEIRKQYFPDESKEIEPIIVDSKIRYNLFKDEAFELTYNLTKNEELKNIYTLLKKKEFQLVFYEINERTVNKTSFNSGDFQFKRHDLTKNDYESCLKYLKLLGYCSEESKTKFIIPPLFRAKMEF